MDFYAFACEYSNPNLHLVRLEVFRFEAKA